MDIILLNTCLIPCHKNEILLSALLPVHESQEFKAHPAPPS